MLTPQGIEEKLHLLMQFLRRTESEYRMLEQEITITSAIAKDNNDFSSRYIFSKGDTKRSGFTGNDFLWAGMKFWDSSRKKIMKRMS